MLMSAASGPLKTEIRNPSGAEHAGRRNDAKNLKTSKWMEDDKHFKGWLEECRSTYREVCDKHSYFVHHQMYIKKNSSPKMKILS